jgi:cytochrome c peroxidase
MQKWRTFRLGQIILGALSIIIVLYGFSWIGHSLQPTLLTETESLAIGTEPIQPIPQVIKLDRAKVALGNQLFHDPQLSHTNTISCASCHSLQTGGVDRQIVSTGINHTEGQINTPTVFNSGFQFRQFWDGRAATLEDQIDGPIQRDFEMGSSWNEIIPKLKRSPQYIHHFRLYPDGITATNVKDAIATFERSLYTPNSRFDQFLRGDPDALSLDEQKGYELFKSQGCISCHQGMLLGGNMYQKIGIVNDYFKERGNITPADLGRFNQTRQEADRYVFKVPSLRNVALTPPYLHDGTAPTLDAAIKAMIRYQVGRQIPQDDIDRIIQFLNTLSGDLPESS